MTGKERIGMGEVRGKGKSESHSKIFVIIIQPRNKNTRSIGVTFFSHLTCRILLESPDTQT